MLPCLASRPQLFLKLLDDHVWIVIRGYMLLVASLCMWGVAAITSWRYGLRDTISRISALFAALLAATAISLQLPYALFIGLATSLLFAVYCMANASLRRPLFVLLGASAAYATVFTLGIRAMLPGWHHAAANTITVTFFLCWMSSLVCEAAALKMTRRLMNC